MKSFVAWMLIAGSMLAGSSSAQPPVVSPLIGRWQADVSRMPIPPAARPKSVTITFRDAGAGRWGSQVEVVYANGTVNHAEGTSALDGTPAPVEGNFEADLAATKMPVPSVLILTLSKGGVPGSTRIYAVAADGHSMVETSSYYGQRGEPILRTNYFTRVK